MNLEKNDCVKAVVDTGKRLQLTVNSIGEDVELLEQAIVDLSVLPKGSIEEKELLIRLSSIEEELDALSSLVKEDMDKLVERLLRKKIDPEDHYLRK